MVHGGVLHDVMQDGRAQHVRVADPGAADEYFEGLQQVLGVGSPGRALLVAVEAQRERHGIAHRVARGGGQQAAQLGFRLLPGVPVGEEFHIASEPVPPSG